MSKSFADFIIYIRFKGSLVLDGFYTDNLPVFDSNTISVSPFAGDASICPKDDRIFSFLKIEMPHGNNYKLKKPIMMCIKFLSGLKNVTNSMILSFGNMRRLFYAVVPPSVDSMEELCLEGYQDALRFLKLSLL